MRFISADQLIPATEIAIDLLQCVYYLYSITQDDIIFYNIIGTATL